MIAEPLAQQRYVDGSTGSLTLEGVLLLQSYYLEIKRLRDEVDALKADVAALTP